MFNRQNVGRHDRLVQKIALTAIVDQAHNSNKRPLLRGPTDKLPFGSLTFVGALSRRRSSARKNEHTLRSISELCEIDGHCLPVSALIDACMFELIGSRMQSVISIMS
jgi:hypothetical protein